ncbi:FAD-dependent monooxygenase [Nocardia sp. No.11]|uniref:FAD-dependent oxidoreductase n=1 Tax=Nocardia sp. No.11 TaxID=3128861 RepID=UPI00319E6759
MATNSPLRVIVVGGGIGGLALANGLRRAGVAVSVHEREVRRTDRLQGFRIHINPHGSAALAELLSPELFATFVACSGKGGNGFGFVTEQLSSLIAFDSTDTVSADGDHYGISRITLRRILLAELGDAVRYGSAFDRYERRPDGRVVAHFADGGSDVGDVLVGADGGTSRVRAQYLPQAQRVDTGIVTIAGKYALTPSARDRLYPRLLAHPHSVIPPSGCGMFVAPHEFTPPAPGVALGSDGTELTPGFLFDDTQPYVFWAFAAERDRFGVDLSALDPAELHATAVRMTAGWAPALRRLVAESDSTTATLLPIKTSVPIPRWSPTTVTLLGDAIHSMTPFAGIGANTALRDAQLLCRMLVAADRRERGLLDAIGAYEAAMTDYGFAAVRTSLSTAERAVADGRFGRMIGKLVLRTAGAVPSMKRKMFADLGA